MRKTLDLSVCIFVGRVRIRGLPNLLPTTISFLVRFSSAKRYTKRALTPFCVFFCVYVCVPIEFCHVCAILLPATTSRIDVDVDINTWTLLSVHLCIALFWVLVLVTQVNDSA